MVSAAILYIPEDGTFILDTTEFVQNVIPLNIHSFPSTLISIYFGNIYIYFLRFFVKKIYIILVMIVSCYILIHEIESILHLTGENRCDYQTFKRNTTDSDNV